MSSKKDFVQFLEEELDKRGFNRADLSRMSTISQAHISRIFNNDSPVSLEFYKKISLALDLPLKTLLEKSGTIESSKDEKYKITQIRCLLNDLNDSQLEMVAELILLLRKYQT